MFNRKNLSSDAIWLVEEVVSALQAQHLLIVTDLSFDEVSKRYTGPDGQINVMKPDDLKSVMLELLSERAKQG